MPEHNLLSEEQLHLPYHYIQQTDPGAVGPGLFWLELSGDIPGDIYRRNASNTAWVRIHPSFNEYGTIGLSSLVGAFNVVVEDALDNVFRFLGIKQGKGITLTAGAADITIAMSTLTTKGDILSHSSSTLGRLAIGVNGQVLVTDSTQTLGLKWVDLISAAGGGLASAMPHDIPPVAAHAKDDEFSGAALDGKWTSPISSLAGLETTVTFNGGWIIFEPTTAGTASTALRGPWGIRQASPAGSFTITARMEDGGPWTLGDDDTRIGLWVATNAGKIHLLNINNLTGLIGVLEYIGITTYSETAAWSTYDGTIVNAPVWNDNAPRQGKWGRIEWISSTSTINTYFSLDGVTWTLVNTRATMTQPDKMGLAMWGNGATTKAHHRALFSWFRCTEP